MPNLVIILKTIEIWAISYYHYNIINVILAMVICHNFLLRGKVLFAVTPRARAAHLLEAEATKSNSILFQIPAERR